MRSCSRCLKKQVRISHPPLTHPLQRPPQIQLRLSSAQEEEATEALSLQQAAQAAAAQAERKRADAKAIDTQATGGGGAKEVRMPNAHTGRGRRQGAGWLALGVAKAPHASRAHACVTPLAPNPEILPPSAP